MLMAVIAMQIGQGVSASVPRGPRSPRPSTHNDKPQDALSLEDAHHRYDLGVV
jgi:hypothetical protein